ncbi:unnamed protein product, partial [Prorocentrum cordatum]
MAPPGPPRRPTAAGRSPPPARATPAGGGGGGGGGGRGRGEASGPEACAPRRGATKEEEEEEEEEEENEEDAPRWSSRKGKCPRPSDAWRRGRARPKEAAEAEASPASLPLVAAAGSRRDVAGAWGPGAEWVVLRAGTDRPGVPMGLPRDVLRNMFLEAQQHLIAKTEQPAEVLKQDSLSQKCSKNMSCIPQRYGEDRSAPADCGPLAAFELERPRCWGRRRVNAAQACRAPVRQGLAAARAGLPEQARDPQRPAPANPHRRARDPPRPPHPLLV